MVLEVENFAAVETASKILRGRGFTVSAVATERESTPGVASEVRGAAAVRGATRFATRAEARPTPHRPR